MVDIWVDIGIGSAIVTFNRNVKEFSILGIKMKPKMSLIEQLTLSFILIDPIWVLICAAVSDAYPKYSYYATVAAPGGVVSIIVLICLRNITYFKGK